MAGGLVLVCTSTSLAATLKIATVSPDGSVWMKHLRAASKEIEANTDGRVRLKLYPGGVMGDDRAVMRKMRVGQLQGAVVTTGVFNRIFPDLRLYNMPMQFRSLAEVDHVRPRFDAELMQGLEDAGFICVGFAEVGMAYAMATREARSLADARGLKIWTPHGDELAVRALAEFGIAAVPLTISDVLAGLQTGLIDTVVAPFVGAVALQWHGQLKYVLDLPFIYIYAPLVLVKRPFERLEPEDQAVVRKVLGVAVGQADARNRRDHEAVRNVLQGQGLRFCGRLPPRCRSGRPRRMKSRGSGLPAGWWRRRDTSVSRPSWRVQGQVEVSSHISPTSRLAGANPCAVTGRTPSRRFGHASALAPTTPSASLSPCRPSPRANWRPQQEVGEICGLAWNGPCGA